MNAKGESDDTLTEKDDPDNKGTKLKKAEIETRVQENKLRDEFKVPYRITP